MSLDQQLTPSAADNADLPMPPPKRSGFEAAVANIRGRIIAGLLLVLPFFVTFWIVYWLYQTLDEYVMSPMARLVVRLAEGGAVAVPTWFTTYVAPVVGLIATGLILYFLGFFARTRIARFVDVVLLKVPIVTPIYSAVSRTFQSLSGTGEMSKFKRVVMVTFPHPGMRSAGFVTSSCRDEATGKTILCVYLPTTPIPTSGYMLFVPEDEVTELDWTLEETVGAAVSFGLTAPQLIQYFPIAEKDLRDKAVKRGPKS
jgi:uncharacterized membrane protein